MRREDWPDLPLEDQHRWWKEAGARELSEILHWRWDPIGVGDAFPAARDEYDAYLAGVVELLKRDASAEEIAEHLHTIERDDMGLRAYDPTRRTAVARLLSDWYPASIARWRDHTRDDG